MRIVLALAGLALAVTGCGTTPTPRAAPDRGQLIRGIVASTVQLKSEHEAGVSRAASGVVVATHYASRRMWIATARHFLEPRPQQIYVRLPGQTTLAPATIAFVSGDRDLAIIETEYADIAPPRLKMVTTLGDEILLVSFPWGQRFTVVRGVVSQIDAPAGELPVAGPARMVSATVSYGSSGGGVFDAQTGELIGIVESYRTAKVAIPEMKERVLEVPIAGETTLIPARLIAVFLEASGLKAFVPK